MGDKWISVKHEMPNQSGDWVLVFADGAMNCCGYTKEQGFHSWTHERAPNIVIEDITHWMPLPGRPL